jgi:hypothetical protein
MRDSTKRYLILACPILTVASGEYRPGITMWSVTEQGVRLSGTEEAMNAAKAALEVDGVPVQFGEVTDGSSAQVGYQ